MWKVIKTISKVTQIKWVQKGNRTPIDFQISLNNWWITTETIENSRRNIDGGSHYCGGFVVVRLYRWTIAVATVNARNIVNKENIQRRGVRVSGVFRFFSWMFRYWFEKTNEFLWLNHLVIHSNSWQMPLKCLLTTRKKTTSGKFFFDSQQKNANEIWFTNKNSTKTCEGTEENLHQNVNTPNAPINEFVNVNL